MKTFRFEMKVLKNMTIYATSFEEAKKFVRILEPDAKGIFLDECGTLSKNEELELSLESPNETHENYDDSYTSNGSSGGL